MIYLLAVLLSISWAKTEDPKKVTHPQVISFSGAVQLQTAKDMSARRPKIKEVLREFCYIKTQTGQVEIEIDPYRSLIVLPNSEVTIPNISWDSGEISEVIIKNGEIFWHQKSREGRQIPIKSEIFDIVPPPGQFKWAYDLTKARSEVKVLAGRLEFSAMNSENSALLVAGQQVSFQGVKEDGDLAYDVLLKGRKIPKGILGKVEAVSPSEMQQFSQAEVERRKREDLKRLKTETARKAPLLPGQICRKPNAKLNECTWTCLKNVPGGKDRCHTENPGTTCVRRRCNANGAWGEETTLEAGDGAVKCRAKAHIAPCDY